MNDADFLAAFEAGTLEEFPHRSHVRMAYLLLRRDGRERATARILEGIRRFAAAKNAHAKFHVTLTLFWIHMVDAALRSRPAQDGFEPFLAAHPELSRSDLPNDWYSQEVLMGDAARADWVAPDKKPLP
jgi:hypothetical protein